MVHLTIDSILDLMKCSNNDMVHTENRTVGRNIPITTGVLGWGTTEEQCYLLSIPSPVTLVEIQGFSQMS